MFGPPNVMKRCRVGWRGHFKGILKVSPLRKAFPASDCPRAAFPVVILSSRRVAKQQGYPLTKQPMTSQALVLGQQEQIRQPPPRG